MKKILFLVLFMVTALLQQAVAQDRTVSGRVIDRATNEGLPGATILVKGTTLGTAAGADGSFSLTVPASATELDIRSVGYTNMVQAIADGPMTISLVTDNKQLSEVVVTALGIEKEKRTLGYSTQTIEAAQLTQGRDRSVLNSLQGKVAGVQINNASGGVGSSTRVVIRGNKSFTNNNQPLYVIDGIPIDNSSVGTGDNLNNGVDYGNRANDINPEDVESMNILKGPAATALYGSRAANGAIIITTKSGRGAARNGKKAEVTFTSSYVIDDILFLPKFQNEFGQGTSVGSGDTRENWSFGPRFDGVDRVWGQVVNNQQRSKPYVGLKNNVREFFDYGKTFNNSLSLGGGNEKSNYILTASHTSQTGVTPGTEYERSSVKIGGETKLTNKLISSANLTYTHIGSKLAATGQGDNSVYDAVLQTPRDISLLELKDLNNPFNTINGYYGAYTINPWQVLNDNQNVNRVDRLFGNAQLGYVFNDHFRITGRAGVDTYSDRRSQFTARRDPDPNGQNSGTSDNGVYSENQISYQEITTDVIATYNGNITPDITISALVGQNFNQRRRDIVGLQADALVSNSIGASFANNAGAFINPNAGFTDTDFERRILGAYGTLDLGFRDFLFLGLQARNDWSSTLPKENRSFFYPAASVSFVFSELLNLQENKFFNFGKLRVNYAQAGIDADPYLTQSTFSITNPTNGFGNNDLLFPIGNVVAYTVGNRIGSNTLQPELTKSLEIGTELRFFQNRLTADVSVYDSRTTNQIVNVPISSAAGFTTQTRNVGEVQNRGIEVLVNSTPVRVGGFSWDLGVNFTKNDSKVLSIFPGTEEIAIGGLGGASLTARVGEPYGVIRAVEILKTPTGQIIVDGNGIPQQSAIQTIGTITPDFTAGLTSTFSYKGLALNVVVDTRQGGIMYSRTKSIQRFVGTSPETLYNDRQPFIVPNSVVDDGDGNFVENTTPVDVPSYWTAMSNNAGTNVIDASYTKLREVALSYALPSKLLEKTPFGALSIGITGRNLLLWRADGNTFVDPEINSFGNGNVQGFDFTSSPSLRSYGANIRVTF